MEKVDLLTMTVHELFSLDPQTLHSETALLTVGQQLDFLETAEAKAKVEMAELSRRQLMTQEEREARAFWAETRGDSASLSVIHARVRGREAEERAEEARKRGELLKRLAESRKLPDGVLLDNPASTMTTMTFRKAERLAKEEFDIADREILTSKKEHEVRLRWMVLAKQYRNTQEEWLK
jgi:hypothetical protein